MPKKFTTTLPSQDALASFDFLNKRNSIAVKPDVDRSVEQDLQHPDLELITIQKETEIRWEPPSSTV